MLQRTPQWVVPLGIGPFRRMSVRGSSRIRWPTVTGAEHRTVFGFRRKHDVCLPVVTPEDRQARYEAAWKKGNGFSFMLETFSDITVTPEANKTATDFIKSNSMRR